MQAAWQYRHRAGVGGKLRERRKGQPERVLTIADEAQRRLTGRYQRLVARGKNSNKIVIAIARELVRFLWAALRDDRVHARAGTRTSPIKNARASAAPSAATSHPEKKTSRAEVGPRRKARKEKRAD